MDLNPSRRPLTSIFIPEWLYNSYWVRKDGNPAPRLHRYLRAQNWQFLTFFAGCFVIPIVLLSKWKDIDSHLCPNIIECQDPCIVEADADIAGIGVRIATYIQAFSGTLLLGFSSHDTSGVRTTIVITSLALVGTSIILNIENTLSLNHAMVVYDLLTMTILPMHFVEPWRVRSPGLYAAQQCRFLLWCALSFWLWTKTPCLGNTPECNQCTRTTSFFFWTAHACRNLNRSFHIFSVLLVLIIWLRSHTWTYGPQNYVLTLPALVLEQHAQRWTDYVRKNEEALQIWRRRRIRSMKNPIVIVTKFYHWYDDETTIAQGIKERRWMRTATSWAQRRTRLSLIWSDARLAVRVPRAQRMLIALVFVTFYTYATERIITMNLTKDANTWGYGQTASLILTVPAVGTLARLALSLWKRSSGPETNVKRAYTVP